VLVSTLIRDAISHWRLERQVLDSGTRRFSLLSKTYRLRFGVRFTVRLPVARKAYQSFLGALKVRPMRCSTVVTERRLQVGKRWRCQRVALLALVLVTPVLGMSVLAQASGSSSSTVSSAASCAARVVDGVLPSWARAGFSESKPRMRYELGTDHEIAAILWADPLLAPPSATYTNKILWVSHVSTNGSPLLISAQRMNGSQPVGQALRRRVTGGPGPSIINLPAAGCWRFNLRWSGHHDLLDVDYVANPAT
jgi:hypothetical protein